MTAIVGITHKGVVYIGGDSGCLTGSTIRRIADTKLFVKNDILFGACGDVRTPQIIKYNFVIGNRSSETIDEYIHLTIVNALRNCLLNSGVIQKTNEKEGIFSIFMLGYCGRLFTINSDFSVVETSHGYDAIGSGESYALGSLSTTSLASVAADLEYSPERRIILALEAATQHDPYVIPPYTVMKI